VTAGNVTCQGPVQVGSPVLYYVHVDHLNTPRAITNETQQLVWRWEHQEPFGRSPPEENPSGLGSFEFPLRFPGTYADRETGTLYNYFRDYDPQTGRYVQSDPVGLRGGLNTYAYTFGDPVNLTDPTGEAVPLVILIPIVGGGINAVASAISAARECDAGWGDIAAAAGRGFASGAVGTAVGLGVGIVTKNPALIGSSAGLAENITNQLLSGRGMSDLDTVEATLATGFGALGGVAARAAFPPSPGRPASLLRSRGLEDFGPKSIDRIRDEAAAGAVSAGLGVAAIQTRGNACGCRP
jgi:RHS repeat-associated protein